jgi:serine/threonine-protein kinase
MPFRLAANRYEIGEELDHGGMGTVFVAYDTYQGRRKVALKTISGTPETIHLELFQRELSVLGSLSHPNIVDVYDSGYLDEHGSNRKPFFVMPLLDGQTLDKRLQQMGVRGHFNVDEAIMIIDQVARGLMAAHERGIIHRDLKPSNVFLLRDLSVKVIDFGVAQLVGARTEAGQKGTLLYMAPEQLRNNDSSALSDQFALGAVFYEVLVGHRAFERDNKAKVIEAILHEIPPIASEIDRNVPMVISQIVHKMIAKNPERRFASMRAVIETLQKAVRREPVEYFNPENFKQSIQSARAAFQDRNYELASEILYTVEAEGYVDSEALQMRKEALEAIRGSRVAQDLKHAHELVDYGNYTLANEKIASVLTADPSNIDALTLEKEIRKKLEAQNIASLKRLARQHLDNRNFDRARESLDRVLKVNETDSEALQMLNEVDRQDVEFQRLIGKQQNLYQSARRAWQQGEVTSALNKIEWVLGLDNDLRSPDSDQRAAYEKFYQEVKARADSLRTARVEIQRSIDRRDFTKAREVCDGILAEDPNNAAFQALRVDIEDRQQRALLETIADVDAKLAREPRIDERLKILEDAVAQFPGEPHFEGHLQAARRKQDTVNRLVEKARVLEDQRRFEESVNLWEIVETTYPAFPGLTFELERVRELRDAKRRDERRAELAQEVERYLEFRDYDKAQAALRDARVELQNDPVVDELERKVAGRRNNADEAAQLLKQGRSARESKDWSRAAEALRRAFQLEPKDREIRAEFLFTLASFARGEADVRPAKAHQLAAEGLQVEPSHAGLRALSSQLAVQTKDDDLNQLIERANDLLAIGDVNGAMAVVEEAFQLAPGSPALEQLQEQINSEYTRQSDLDTLQRIQIGLEGPPPESSIGLVESQLEVLREIGERSGGDQRIAALTEDLEGKLEELLKQFRNDTDTFLDDVPVPPPPPPLGPPPVPLAAREQIVDVTPIVMPPVPPPMPFRDDTVRATSVLPVGVPLPPVPTFAPMPPQQQPMAPAPSSSKRWIGIAAAAFLAVVAIAGAIVWKRNSAIASAPATAEFRVEVNPAGAATEISIDGVPAGESPVKRALTPGAHRVEAKRAGFKNLVATINAGSKPDRIVLTMEPDGIPIHFVTDFRGMTILLDGKQIADEEGGPKLEAIVGTKDATHTVEVASGSIDAKFGLVVKNGLAELHGPLNTVQTKGAAVLFAEGGKAPHWLFAPDSDVSIDNASMQMKSDAPLAVGTHQAKMAPNLERAFDISSASGIWVFLSAGSPKGNLFIASNVPGADVFIDGKKYSQKTPASVPAAYVRNMRLRVVKEGYQPHDEIVPISAGADKHVNVELKPLPKAAGPSQ